MTNQHVYIIAEAGVNHNGRLDLALKLCDAAKAAGVDAVKFQTWKTELIITKGTKKAEYQEKNLNNDDDQFTMLKKLELSYDNFQLVKQYCDEIGIQFLSTADETESLDFLVNLGMPFIKLGSGDITNIPYLRSVAKYGIPVILSTGMANLAQVAIAYDTLQEAGVKDISILHCTTNYPCPMNEVNLRAMLTMKEAFKCRVGYSDHTMGIEVPIAAVAMGAEIIEKHFTLDKNMEGPDHKASLNPEELKDTICYVACPLRYSAALQYVKQNIDFSKSFSVRAISSSYLPDWRPGQDYRKCYSAHRDMGGGVGIDLIHEWDYLTWLFGNPVETYSIQRKISNLEIDSDDIAIYIGRTSTISIELHLDYFGRSMIRTLEMFLPNDTIRCDIEDGRIEYLRTGKVIQLPSERNEYQMREIEHFFEIINNKIENDSTMEHAFHVLKLAKGE